MHLTEVLIASGLLAAVCTSLPPAFAAAVRANRASADTTRTAVMAAQKLEEVRSLPFMPGGIDQSFDVLDQRGLAVDGTAASAAYLRSWRAEPLPMAPDDAIMITVTVSPYSRSIANGSAQTAAGSTRLVTLRTKKAP